MKTCRGVLLLTFLLLWGCKQDEPPSSPQEGEGNLTLQDFTSAQTCSACHPQQFKEWNGSMHRYSTSDPIWMLANNSLQAGTQGKLQKTCFMCHAPIGFLTGNTVPTFQFSDLEPLVREGITCDFCHVLRAPFVSTNQHIQYTVKPGKTKYGPLSNPVASAKHESAYDGAYDRSEYCRQCHDLTVNNVPVEITVTEWQNSVWGAMSVECQKCHMPAYTGQAAVGGPTRENLHRHDFVGVDIAFDDFPNKSEQHAAIDSLLKNSVSMALDVPSTIRHGDSIDVDVSVYNDKTGHNVPTSVFFFRQMWIEVTVWNGPDTVYRSGYLDANGDLMDNNSALQSNADKDLVLFGGTLYKNGQESNIFELDSLVNNSIPPFATRHARYKCLVSEPGEWNVRARLLFRPFGPYLLRALGAERYIPELRIFEMNTSETILTSR
ncbi:MAG TPA: multiheme c-type cytochrome [Bacteroidota bacterium]|nr:multiheme c-type cytochrome [Bacteroidota bacterium]